jgi:hypothetical protein
MEQENQALKIELLAKDVNMFVKALLISAEMKKFQKQMFGSRSESRQYPHVEAVNQAWKENYPTCPTIITRGQRKGEVCGGSQGWGKFHLPGQAEMLDPCCDKHKWSAHPKFSAYKKVFDEALRKDNEVNQVTEAAELQKKQEDRQKDKNRLQDFLVRIDRLEAEQGPDEKLNKLRTGLQNLETVFGSP